MRNPVLPFTSNTAQVSAVRSVDFLPAVYIVSSLLKVWPSMLVRVVRVPSQTHRFSHDETGVS